MVLTNPLTTSVQQYLKPK